MLSELIFELIYTLEPFLPMIGAGVAFAISTATSLHVLLSGRAPGSSIAWIALVWLAPLLGALAYVAFGINRIKRRAESIRPPHPAYRTTPQVEPVTADMLADQMQYCAPRLESFFPLANRVLNRPLLPGAAITPLKDGDEAYLAMLEAIDEAGESINLSTYIFDNDVVGKRFVDALRRAQERGVEVRVLIDAAGLRYSWPSILHPLRKAGIKVARFLPSLIPPHIMTLNLRNHRKLLIVDGQVGFTGGINIRHGHLLGDAPKHPIRDLHFCVRGPVVAHMQEVFVDDWAFTTGEELRGEAYFPALIPEGKSFARGIPDGPDENLDKLKWILLGAITAASKSVRIITPYFIPDESMVSALTLAAMRDVKVEIIIPEKGNLPFVQWASMAHLRPLLRWGCEIALSEAPFDHSKLVVVDDAWVLFGSANLDPRSLRLNFEFNIESWDESLASDMTDFFASRRDSARVLTLEAYEKRSKFAKIRDGLAALASPYL